MRCVIAAVPFSTTSKARQSCSSHRRTPKLSSCQQAGSGYPPIVQGSIAGIASVLGCGTRVQSEWHLGGVDDLLDSPSSWHQASVLIGCASVPTYQVHLLDCCSAHLVASAFGWQASRPRSLAGCQATAILGKKRKAPAPQPEVDMQDRKPIELEAGWSFMQVMALLQSLSCTCGYACVLGPDSGCAGLAERHHEAEEAARGRGGGAVHSRAVHDALHVGSPLLRRCFAAPMPCDAC